MLHKKVYFSTCILSILFLFGFTSNVDAEAPSVIDCLEDKAACEEDVGDSTSETELETEQDDQKSEIGKTGSLLFSIIKTVFALILVLGLIYLLIKFLSKRNKMFQQVKALENLGGISVGQNKSIQVVRIGSQVFLVGVGENVEMLQEITDEQVKQDLLHSDEQAGDASQASQWLPTFLQSKTDEKNRTSDFKQLFTKELDKLKKNRREMINQRKQKEDEHE